MALLEIPDAVYNWFVSFSEKGTVRVMDAWYFIQYYPRVCTRPSLLRRTWPLLHKYADDTYIVIAARNVESREAELDHVAQWAHVNNLKLNRARSVEVIFTSRRKLQGPLSPELPDVRHVTTITMLGVTITNHLSVTEHVSGIMSRCAQSLRALKVSR